jgi:hypothetical protein
MYNRETENPAAASAPVVVMILAAALATPA